MLDFPRAARDVISRIGIRRILVSAVSPKVIHRISGFSTLSTDLLTEGCATDILAEDCAFNLFPGTFYKSEKRIQ